MLQASLVMETLEVVQWICDTMGLPSLVLMNTCICFVIYVRG
jgi:hypothetical protein